MERFQSQYEKTPVATGQTHGRVLMGSLPEFGQLNPLFAIAERLLARGHEVHFASGASAKGQVDKFNTIQVKQFDDTKDKQMIFHDMGDEDCVNDHNYMASATDEVFAEYKRILRRGPRNYGAFRPLIDLVMAGDFKGRKIVTDRFVELIRTLKPDIVVVDQFTAVFVEGVRVTGVDYIITAPASPATLSTPLPWLEPISGTNLEAPLTLKSKLLNIWYFVNLIPRVISHPKLLELRDYRLNILKLKPTTKAMDASPFSKFHPSWTNQKAIISPNLDFRQTTPFDKVVFVGTCTQRRIPIAANSKGAYDLEIQNWLDDAVKKNENVIYMNLGTIFRYNQEEIDESIKAINILADKRPGGRPIRVLWKIPGSSKFDLSKLPSTVKKCEWLQDPLIVYEHPAIKAAVNHGGGNSFNEALQYGIPQLVCSQWFDTIDYGVYARVSGIGLSSANPGRLEAEDMAAKLSRLLTEPQFATTTQTWALKSRAAGGSRAAADVVETYLENRFSKRVAHLNEADNKPLVPKSSKLYRLVFALGLAAVVSYAYPGLSQVTSQYLPSRIHS